MKDVLLNYYQNLNVFMVCEYIYNRDKRRNIIIIIIIIKINIIKIHLK